MTKRLFDICSASIGLLLFSPLFVFIAITIITGGKGGIFFVQERVGKNGKVFRLFKFRTMQPGSEAKGQITVGGHDSRITSIGHILRKYKLDELPQLFNVLKGEMSVVGPRPEVSQYVALYNHKQQHVLSVLPGLTDYASIAYVNENEVLGASQNPEQTYISDVMPHKLELNLKYITDADFGTDLQVIVRTIIAIIN